MILGFAVLINKDIIKKRSAANNFHTRNKPLVKSLFPPQAGKNILIQPTVFPQGKRHVN